MPDIVENKSAFVAEHRVELITAPGQRVVTIHPVTEALARFPQLVDEPRVRRVLSRENIRHD